MVLSKINDNVSFPETKILDPVDENVESDMYQITIYDTDIIISIGHVKNTFEDENILYYPVYLITNNNSATQIGVYEIIADESYNYTNKDGNLDFEKMEIEPLIYKFVTKDMLLKKRLEPDKEENGDEDSSDEEKNVKMTDTMYEIPENRKDIFVLTKGVSIPKELKEETAKHAKNHKEKYHESPSDNWVQKFIKNSNFDIIDNEGGGDCLFATIRDAFSSIAQQTSVNKLRKKLSDEVNDEVFQSYKEQYDMYNSSILLDTNKIKELAAEYVLLKQKFASVIDHYEQKIISENAKKVKSEHDKLVQEKKVTASLLKDYKFMKGIDTLEKLQKKVRTCEFWAEIWSISTLERILNIKFVILSSESYKSGDTKNVLQCGEIDKILQNKGTFNPEFYIIVDYTGSHYKTVSYKNKMIFKFSELPYDVKKMIAEKCLEKNAGPFSLINDFKKFKSTIQTKPSVKEDDFDELNEARLKGLYDDDVVFQFYSKSNNKYPPGKGAGEKIPNNKIIEYRELASIPEWRKKLSNMWVDPQPFTLDNHKWASVEHYYQASKFKKNNPEFYLSFSVDSGTDLSKDPTMATAAGGKSGKFKGELLRPVQVEIDSDFFGKRHKQEMYAAQYAKFTQSKDDNLKKLLLATDNAKLTHFSRGSPPITFDDLMLIRDKLKRSET